MKKWPSFSLLFSFFFLISCTLVSGFNSGNKKTAKPIVFLDPGHGGKNLGTRSFDKRYLEKQLTLTTALMTKEYLEKRGYRVYLSRHNDTFVSLRKRVKMAEQRKAHLFVSIHYNWARNKQAKGIEIFYYKDPRKSRRFRSYNLAKAVLRNTRKQSRAPSRGLKQARFLVIRTTTMPAILVEGGFMSNRQEMQRLKNRSYLNRLAKGIADGIHDYLRQR